MTILFHQLVYRFLIEKPGRNLLKGKYKVSGPSLEHSFHQDSVDSKSVTFLRVAARGKKTRLYECSGSSILLARHRIFI